jgi:prolyl 4-hydroxylase
MTQVDYKAAIGPWVRARLNANPDVMAIPSKGLDIFIARAFLTPEECADMIALIDANRSPSKLLAPSGDPEFRTSESCNVHPANPLVRRIEEKLAALTGLDPTHRETIQGQRYAVGQQFKPHHDFFHEGQAYWQQMQETGGQRTWTAMAFLNTPEGGGQTHFEHAAVKVSPRAGNLLLWNNLTDEGTGNLYSLHHGMPVTAGVKYVITKWHRERTWIALTEEGEPVPTNYYGG